MIAERWLIPSVNKAYGVSQDLAIAQMIWRKHYSLRGSVKEAALQATVKPDKLQAYSMI